MQQIRCFYIYIRICKLYIFADHPAVHPAGRGLHGLAEGVPRPPPHLQAIEDTQDEHCVDSGTAPLVSQEASAARRRLRLNVWVLFTLCQKRIYIASFLVS